MLPIYNYFNIWSLVKDIEDGFDIYCKFGKISQVVINDSPSSKSGYIQLYIESYNRVYREATRYAFTFDEFLHLMFSKLAYGMYYYIYIKNLGTYWDFAALTDSQQLAYNQYGYELYLKELKLFYPASIPLSPKVINVSVIPGDSQLTISWDSISGATSYILYWTYIPDVTVYSNRVEDIYTNSYTLTGLNNNEPVYFRIAVMNPNYPTQNPMSDEMSAVPQPLPDIPVLSGTLNISDISLSWTPLETPQFFNITGDHYQIFWNQTGSVSVSDTLIDNIKQNYYDFTSLTPGEYYYKIRKVNLRGFSGLSNEIHITVL